MTNKQIEVTKTQLEDLLYWLDYVLDLQTDWDNRAEITALLATIKNQTRPTPKSY